MPITPVMSTESTVMTGRKTISHCRPYTKDRAKGGFSSRP